MKLSTWQKVTLYVMMTAFAVPLLVPLFWLISTSLKPSLGIDETPLYVLPRTKFQTIEIDGMNVPVKTFDKLGDKTPPEGEDME